MEAEPTPPPAAPTPAIAKTVKGGFVKGKSGNPSGRPKGTKNYNLQLWTAIKNFKITDQSGASKTFLQAMLVRALQDPHVLGKLIDKLFADPTPKPDGVAVNVNAGHHESISISHVLGDPAVREAALVLEERLGKRLAHPGGNGTSR